MNAVPSPEASLTGGQPFLPTQSKMGGDLSLHPQTDVPEAQDDSQVDPEEQKQYDDFVIRARLFYSDPRVPLNSKGAPVPNGKSPRDLILQHLNAGSGDTADAVGRSTASVAWLISQNARQQGHPYSPDVIYHGADEIMSDLYTLAVRAGLVKNPPPENSPEEEHLLGLAKLVAVKHYGQNEIDSGQANSKEAQDYYLQQIEREGKSGGLDNWDPSQQFTPAEVQAYMRKAAQGDLKAQGRPMPRTTADFASMGHPQLVPPDGGGGAQPPDQGASAPPDAAATPPPPDQSAAPPPGGT